jgi:hypothetical protein
MGVTIHYRGSLADLSRVEDFEDRVIDLALAVGGNPRVWRSADERDPSRMVRGLMIDLAPGQETTSLLISPEGWLIGLFQIEDAERGLAEKPWCWVKTQFGPIEGHVALVELLAALHKEFMPDLEVMDEGGYWERRDVNELRQKIEFLGRAIHRLADELEGDRLSPEAREDPEILATRIERLARKVHTTLSRPAEHPPVHFPDDETGAPPDPVENEARWDELFAENRRKQERMSRVMEEQTIQGVDAGEAFDVAIREAVPLFDLGGERGDDESNEEIAEMIEELNAAAETALNEESADWDKDPFDRAERHPLQQQATNMLMELFDFEKRSSNPSPNFDTLIRNAMEVTGGLAQVVPMLPVWEMDDSQVGVALVQLKRSLRGAAFVRGALFLLRAEQIVAQEEFGRFMHESELISKEITELLRSVREAQA